MDRTNERKYRLGKKAEGRLRDFASSRPAEDFLGISELIARNFVLSKAHPDCQMQTLVVDDAQQWVYVCIIIVCAVLRPGEMEIGTAWKMYSASIKISEDRGINPP